MKIPSLRRSVAGLSLAALAGVGLVSVPTPAHAQVEDGHLVGNSYLSSPDCGLTPVGDGQPSSEKDWTDNGAPVTGSTSATGTVEGVEGDVVDVASSHTMTITSTPLGTGPATITGTSTAKASAHARQETTGCAAAAQAGGIAQGVFTLTKPMWITLTVSGQGQRQGTGQSAGWVAIGSNEGFAPVPIPIPGGLFGFSGEGLMVTAGNRGSAVSSTLLPPGEYGVAYLAAAIASADGSDEGSADYTGTFKIEFQNPGAATPVTGKGASKVQFGERDCASGNVPVNLGKKTVKKAKRVAVRVNGAKGPVLKGKKLKGKHPKAKTITVPTSVTGTVKVKVKITLANGRRVQATRSYLPCK